jgi:hypothetical protein
MFADVEIITISIISGEILELLEKVDKPLSSKTIEMHFSEPRDLILMSIGWLAREGLIQLCRKDNGEYMIKVKRISNYPGVPVREVKVL